MLPTFTGPGRIRQINLGGSSTTYSQQAILDSVKAQREQRLDHRRRLQSAHTLQAWWRGTSEARRVKAQLKNQFDAGNAAGVVEWTRLLVVGWSGGPADAQRLARWSKAMIDGGTNALFVPFSTGQKNSWLVLLRRMSQHLLREVSLNPRSSDATQHLQVLGLLVSPTYPACSKITTSALEKDYYHYISVALQHIPLDDKSSPSLPLLANLIIAPFSIFPPSSPPYITAFLGVFTQILTLPLLPNRFPLPSLTQLSARLPFGSLELVPTTQLRDALLASPIGKAHLLANLAAFVPPRLAKLSPSGLSAYLEILTTLLDSLPADLLEPPSTKSTPQATSYGDSSDDDDEAGPLTKPNATPAPRIKLEAKTLARLQTLVSPAQISTLLSLTSKGGANTNLRTRMFGFLLSVCSVWPSRKEKVLSAVVFSPSGPLLMKEIWRGWVRGSPLGKGSRTGIDALKDPANQSIWPPLLFLVDLYSHALLTMGDDEFFGVRQHQPQPHQNVPRNPLTLDELTAFSKQLMGIVFALYWNEDQLDMRNECVPGLSAIRWEVARERLTRCLKAIHARDSRRKFTPEDHWLMTSQIDMQSFCEAAIFEEQNLDRTSTRTLSKRQMSYISPRLGILNNIPFAIPFSVRVEIFRDFVANDVERSASDPSEGFGYHCSVRRDQIAKDGYDALNGLGPKLKKRVRITFIDQFGNEESGIDGGGVFKEFLTSLSKEAFDTDRGLWLATKQQALYPNPHSYSREAHQLSWYRFIGRVLGKALYEGILVDVNFATFFLAKWLGKQSYLDDLASLDPELYQGLTFLKYYEGNIEDLALNFTVTNNDLGVTSSVNLVPNGANVPVTRENRTHYIYLVSNYRLNTQIKLQSQAFFEGLSDIIDPKWLRMFNQQELQILIGGTEDPVDVADLRANTVYGGAYDDSHDTVKAFWKVLESLDQAQRCQFLRFVSSCARPPLLGFKELNPKFSIRDAGSDNSRLPTASTCVNLLKLPMYANEQVLRRKLLQAIQSNAGFDLS